MTVSTASVLSGGCVQVPIIINDPISRDLRDITFTVSLSGDTGIVAGGITANMVVANGYSPIGGGTGLTGITNPGTNLANGNGTPTPNCSKVFNRATQGSGTPINFAPNLNGNAGWSINNNQGGIGRKQAFLIDFLFNASLGTTVANTDILIAVLEIPIISGPGDAQLLITATPTATLAGGNTYTYDSGGQFAENFTLPANPATVTIADPPIQLKLGDVSVPLASLASGGCIQVPIIINDPISRDLRDITFTVALSGDTGIISGGITANMAVANGYSPIGAGTGVTGITNPGADLANSNGAPTPNCTQVFNRATLAQGLPIKFAPSINGNAGWSISNNQGGVGRKQAFLIDFLFNASLGTTVANTDTLIAVLEIPIISNPGKAELFVTATPDATLADGNTYTYDSGQQIAQDFKLSTAPARVKIGDVPIRLILGDVRVAPGGLISGGCVQVPVMINDSISRDLRDITFTVSLSGDTGIVADGIAANMVVANGYSPIGAGTGITGITNPGTNLANSNGAPTPKCTNIFNRATQGSGTTINFAPNINGNATWSINNNQGGVGRKQAFLIDFLFNASLGTTVANTDTLIAVLEIPIIASPGVAKLLLTATPEDTLPDGNSYTFSDDFQTMERFILPVTSSVVHIAEEVIFDDSFE